MRGDDRLLRRAERQQRERRHPVRDGAKLALKQFLEENDDCDVKFEEFDTEGDPAKATPVANKVAADDRLRRRHRRRVLR